MAKRRKPKCFEPINGNGEYKIGVESRLSIIETKIDTLLVDALARVERLEKGLIGTVVGLLLTIIVSIGSWVLGKLSGKN